MGITSRAIYISVYDSRKIFCSTSIGFIVFIFFVFEAAIYALLSFILGLQKYLRVYLWKFLVYSLCYCGALFAKYRNAIFIIEIKGKLKVN